MDSNDWVSGALVTPVDHPVVKPSKNKWFARSGTVTVTMTVGINLRGTTTGDTTNPERLNILAVLTSGQQVKYDRVLGAI